MGQGGTRYWLDLGNTEATAQVVLGEAPRCRAQCNAPSCSVRMSLAMQGLFINDVAVRYAAQLLYELFSKGRLAQHGVLVNLASKRSGPIDVDPVAWRRFGYAAQGAPAGAVATLPHTV
jgi:hypothetical protein